MTIVAVLFFAVVAVTLTVVGRRHDRTGVLPPRRVLGNHCPGARGIGGSGRPGQRESVGQKGSAVKIAAAVTVVDFVFMSIAMLLVPGHGGLPPLAAPIAAYGAHREFRITSCVRRA